MLSSAMRALHTALETRAFERAYLFHGDDDYLKLEQVRAIIDRATDPATRDFNVETGRGAELTGPALALALEALPMMSERRVVVIHDVTLLKRDARAALDRYLKKPAQDLILVLVAAPGVKVDAELVARTTTVQFDGLDGEELERWLAGHAAKVGARLTPDAARMLCSASEGDMALLAGEVEKLHTYTDGGEIDVAAVGAVTGVRHGETVGDLLDLVASRNGARAVASVPHVLAQPKASGVTIAMALTTQTLAIGWAVAARARGLQQHRLESELFALLRESPSIYVGRQWGEAVKAWTRALRHWDQDEVDRVLDLLVQADLALKETRISSEEALLASLVLAIATPAPARTAA